MGGGRYQAIQFAGEAVHDLSMQERMTLSNMAAELGAQAGLIAPDEVTAEFIRATGAVLPANWKEYAIETAGEGDEALYYDASLLAPQIAAPHSPENADNAEAFRNTAFNLAYIGACQGKIC